MRLRVSGWRWGARMRRAFQLQGSAKGESATEETRTLHFVAAPDYETKSSYAVTVRSLRVGRWTASVEVTVSVSNVEEAGLGVADGRAAAAGGSSGGTRS